MKRFAVTAAAAADVSVTSIVCLDSNYKPTWVAKGTNGDKNLNGAAASGATRASTSSA